MKGKILDKALTITSLAVSAVFLVAVFLTWILMHVLGVVFTSDQVYYLVIFLAIPVGILFVASLLLFLRTNRK